MRGERLGVARVLPPKPPRRTWNARVLENRASAKSHVGIHITHSLQIPPWFWVAQCVIREQHDRFELIDASVSARMLVTLYRS